MYTYIHMQIYAIIHILVFAVHGYKYSTYLVEGIFVSKPLFRK